MNASIGFDRRLWPQDLAQSRAHAKMLAERGIVTREDRDALLRGLDDVERELSEGRFQFSDADEDIHMAIERRLTEIAGPVGGRLHTARSRNDQVATDLAMYTRESAREAQTGVAKLMAALLGRAEQHLQQMSCWMTHTNERTHDIIRSGFDRSPMFTGQIEGVGPRYCPSVEDKINRFADKDSHQIFLEPEGLTTNEYYPNGISTSLPFDIQYALVRSMAGLENAHILRPGYAIEYDYFDPQQLKSSFETKVIGGLFFAGQINGTTGYEEAAAQGLFAGVNAALQAGARTEWQQETWVPGRDEAYLGVLVDDLITKGVTEPYRMFTSRAEFRLQLREDNADMRLTETGRQLGLVDDARWEAFGRKREAVSRETERLRSLWVSPKNLAAAESTRVLGKAIEHEYSLADLLRRPDVNYADLMSLEGGKYASAELNAPVSRETQAAPLPDAVFAATVIEQVEIVAKYSGYIDRQIEEVGRAAHYENLKLPLELDYLQVSALSFEARQKLSKHRPETLGQASRLSGITPAAISLLLVHLKKSGFKGLAAAGKVTAASGLGEAQQGTV